CLAIKRAFSMKSFHCCNSLFFPFWALACIAPVIKRVTIYHFALIILNNLDYGNKQNSHR
ncbi:MAG: hypothetical protein KA462_02275, partial [Clostridia bacterium]|nr:hypothetical protein [Clostridia bacterium]